MQNGQLPLHAHSFVLKMVPACTIRVKFRLVPDIFIYIDLDKVTLGHAKRLMGNMKTAHKTAGDEIGCHHQSAHQYLTTSFVLGALLGCIMLESQCRRLHDISLSQLSLPQPPPPRPPVLPLPCSVLELVASALTNIFESHRGSFRLPPVR